MSHIKIINKKIPICLKTNYNHNLMKFLIVNNKNLINIIKIKMKNFNKKMKFMIINKKKINLIKIIKIKMNNISKKRKLIIIYN
jgi:hypothetical protein